MTQRSVPLKVSTSEVLYKPRQISPFGQTFWPLACMHAKLLPLCLTLCDPMGYIACHAPLSMGFSRQEYWSGLPLSTPRDLPNPGQLLQCRQILYQWASGEAHFGTQESLIYVCRYSWYYRYWFFFFLIAERNGVPKPSFWPYSPQTSQPHYHLGFGWKGYQLFTFLLTLSKIKLMWNLFGTRYLDWRCEILWKSLENYLRIN